MDFADFTRLHDQAALGAAVVADQIVVNAGEGEGGRDRGEFLGAAPVGQDQNRVAFVDGLHRAAAQFRHGLFQAFAALRDLEQGGQGSGADIALVEGADAFQSVVAEHRLFNTQLVRVVVGFLKQIEFVADVGLKGGHQLFADGVERGIGHLGKQLLEVVVHQLRPVGEDGDRGVHAHRSGRLDAVVGHRRQDDFQILEGVAEDLFALEATGRFPGGLGRGCREVF